MAASRAHPPAAPLSDAGTVDVAVERIEEGLAASASGNSLVRNQFDAGKATARLQPKMVANIDTSGTSYIDTAANVRRGQPGSGL